MTASVDGVTGADVDESAVGHGEAGGDASSDFDTVEVADDVDVNDEALADDVIDAGRSAVMTDTEPAPRQGALPLDVKTGDPRVDAAVSSLRGLDHMPVSDHAEVFTQVHRDLQDALLTLDQG